jgi:hypothetical protein
VQSKHRLTKLARGNAVIQAQARAVGVVTACVLWTHLGDPRDYPAFLTTPIEKGRPFWHKLFYHKQLAPHKKRTPYNDRV